MCCAGAHDVPSLWHNAIKGNVCLEIRNLARTGSKIPVYAAGDLSLSPSDRHLTRRADRAAALSLSAAREAWGQSRHQEEILAPHRVGVFVGSARGAVGLNDFNATRGAKRPSDSAYTTMSSIASLVATALKAEGNAIMLSATCTSGAAALYQALMTLRSGALDVAIVGGVDAPLVESLLEQFILTGIASTCTTSDALRPFDQNRCGTVFGEGAGFLVLERKESAQKRGAISLGEIAAVALRCQPTQRTAMDSEGLLLQQVIRACLAEAKLDLQDIDLLHLHGTGTKINDASESRSIKNVFGPSGQQPFSWASKAITGHTLGASSLFQVILTLEAIRREIIPCTVNCSNLDTDCMLRLNTESLLSRPLRSAICTTSGFWGNSSSIVLRK